MRTRTNCLIAFLSLLICAGIAQAVVIDPYAWFFPVANGITGADDLKQELQEQVQAILDAGNLAPLYVSHADQASVGYTLYNEPGRTITTLAWAYPYLTPTQQAAVKTYVQNQLNDANHAPWDTFPLPHSAGAQRETHMKSKWWYERTTFGNRPSVQTIYGLWLYGYRTGDWASIQAKWANIKSMYTSRAAQGNLYGTMCAHVAMARLADKFADGATRTTALNNLQTQLNAGVTFSTIETNTQNAYNSPNMYGSTQGSSIYRGFMFLNLSPEIGRYLADNVSASTLSRNSTGKNTFPLWWIVDSSYFQRDTTGDEGTGLTAETRGMIYPVERWVVGSNAATLRKYSKSGPNGIGDCYWLEALVQTIEAHGTTVWTDVRITNPTAPADPTNLAAQAISITQINLTWDDNSINEDGFKVERKTGAGGTYAEIAGNVVTNSYSDTALTGGTTYYYRVRAYNQVNNSNYTNEASALTYPAGSPNGPTNLQATAVSQTEIDLQWSDNSNNETGFKVERKTGAGGVYAEIASNVAGNTYPSTGLSSSTTYYYRVRATNAQGDSPYSNEAHDTTQSPPTAPNAPSNLAANAASTSQINLTWNDNSSNETQFKLERKTGVGGTYAQIATPAANATGYNDTGLDAATEYYYRICASNGNGDSNYSNEAHDTTQSSGGGGGGNLLTDGDFQSATVLTLNTSYTAGTTADGIWLANAWTKTANAGPTGTGDTAAATSNGNNDLRLMQGIAAPANGTQMTLAFQYVRPGGFANTVTVYGLTNGQAVSVFAGGAIGGTQLFQFTMGTNANWTTVSNQNFTVNGTFTHLVVVVSIGGVTGNKIDNVSLSSSAPIPAPARPAPPVPVRGRPVSR